MKHIHILLLFGVILNTNAQINTKINGSPLDSIQSTVVETILVTDSIPKIVVADPKMLSNEVKPLTETYINEDLSVLSDDEFAAFIDKVWFSELENSSLNIHTNTSNVLPDSTKLTTEIIKKRLAYLDSQTPFHIEYNEILDRTIQRFVSRKAQYSRFLTKATYYFPMIEEQLAKYNIPMEMKYLAVVESGLNPLAKSHVGATGLWQFMYQTGKQFDLKVSSYVDERNDALKATKAACEFLNTLYKTFGDWDLALAAYNSGPGNVSKAIRRAGGSKNYWNIRRHLPRETASYVPLFYATMYIFEFAEQHGIKATPNSMLYYEVDSIRVQRQVTFDQITQAIPIEKNVLKLLNPQYKLDIIPVIEGRDYSLVLPKSLIGKFVQNEDRIYAFAKADDAKREKPLPKYTEMNNRIRYKVKSGDYLGKIAKRFGVSVSKLKRWNSLKSTKLRIGQRLTIFSRRI